MEKRKINIHHIDDYIELLTDFVFVKDINGKPIFQEMIKLSKENSESSVGFKEFFSGKFNLPISLAFLIAFFNQLSGINAVIYYSPRIFAETGMGESASLLSSVGVGFINLIATLIGIFLIDRMGRKFLMYICSISMLFFRS